MSELKTAQICLTQVSEKPSDISEALFQILLSLKTRHATTSRIENTKQLRASWQTRGFPWAKKGFPFPTATSLKPPPPPSSRTLKILGVPLH